jgi:ferrochelatase
VAAAVGDIDWEFVFQSAGASPEPWLGPAIEDRLPELAAEGYTHVVAQPLGFVCDHIEILYDLDIESQGIAADCGLAFSRTESMNTEARFLQAVADAVEPALRELAT